MTEAEWSASTDPMAMLRHVSPEFSAPELLRLQVACVARAPDLQYPAMRAWSKAALIVAEGRADVERLIKLEERTCAPPVFWKLSPAGYAALDVLYGCRREGETLYSEGVEGQSAIREEKAYQAELVRKCFGNPFRGKRTL
jgi:hypothetical protein